MRTLRLSVALVLVLALAAPSAFASSPTTGEAEAELSLALALDVADLPEPLQAEITAAVQADLDTRMQELGLVAAPRDSADLVMRIKVWQPDPDVLIISSGVDHQGVPMYDDHEHVCMTCTMQEVADGSLMVLSTFVRWARGERARDEPPPPSLANTPSMATPSPHAIRIGPLGYTGVALGAVAIGTVILGTTFVHRGIVTDDSSMGPFLYHTDYRPLGVGLVGAGLAGAVLGYGLLAIDTAVLRERRERRLQLTGAGMSFHDGAGLTLSGRF